jgi:ATP-binding cassette subfamily C (CFTR/MRP) protein 1
MLTCAKGRVKWNVYLSYAAAASKTAFVLYCASSAGLGRDEADMHPVLAAILLQAFTLAGNLTLRNWGEHNQDQGHSRDAFRYLLLYGVRAFLTLLVLVSCSCADVQLWSLASALASLAAAVLLWVRVALSC